MHAAGAILALHRRVGGRGLFFRDLSGVRAQVRMRMDVLAVVRILGHETCAEQEPPDAEPEPGRWWRGFAGTEWGPLRQGGWRAGELGGPSTRAAPRLWPGRDAFFSLRELC